MQKETGFKSILTERIEQVKKHGRTLAKDKHHKNGELLKAAKFCRTQNNADWPRGWDKDVRDHIKTKSVDDRLVIEAAFISAEVDRIRGIEDYKFSWAVDEVLANQKLMDRIKEEENKLRHHFCGDVFERTMSVVHHYKSAATKATTDRDELIESMRVYLQSFVMLAESVGLANTHGEKAARLRGMIELLNNTIKKLAQKETDYIFDNWNFGMIGSDFPYSGIMRKYEELKSENESLKREINSRVA